MMNAAQSARPKNRCYQVPGPRTAPDNTKFRLPEAASGTRPDRLTDAPIRALSMPDFHAHNTRFARPITKTNDNKAAFRASQLSRIKACREWPALAKRRNAEPGQLGRSLRASVRAASAALRRLDRDDPAGATAPCGLSARRPAE
jgi:hypothetical protein